MKNFRKKMVLVALAGFLALSPVSGSNHVYEVWASQTNSRSDSRLSALDIAPGVLNPAFSPDVLEYTSTIDAGVTSVQVQAVPRAAQGSIASVEGARNLQPGLNEITVVCSAPDQSYSTYKIHLTVGEATQEEEAEAQDDAQSEEELTGESEENLTGQAEEGETGAGETGTEETVQETASLSKAAKKLVGSVASDGTVTLSKAAYKLSNNFSYGSIRQEIPSGFEQGSAQIQGTDYQTLVCEKNGATLVYMENTDGQGSTGFYFYDEQNNTVERFKFTKCGDNYLVMINLPREELPGTYSEKTIKLPSEKKVIAYEVADTENMYLVYGLNSNGDSGWYFYDNSQGTYLRYVSTYTESSGEIGTEEDAEELERTVSLDKYNALFGKYDSLKKNQIRIVSILVIALVLMLIFFTILYMRLKDSVEEQLQQRKERKKAPASSRQRSLKNGQEEQKGGRASKRTVITDGSPKEDKEAPKRQETQEERQRRAEEERERQRRVYEEHERQREAYEEQERRKEAQKEQERKARAASERERQRQAYERQERQRELEQQARAAKEESDRQADQTEPSIVRKTTLTRQASQTSEDAMLLAQEKMRQSVQLAARRMPKQEQPQDARQSQIDKEAVFRPTKRVNLEEAEIEKEHDPMDDWEVDETKAASKRSRKKKRGRNDDVEIMDLNDL